MRARTAKTAPPPAAQPPAPRGLQQHEFYVYYDGCDVFARMGNEAPVLVETCATPQEAHDKVQKVLNPQGHRPDVFGPKGFCDPRFQKSIAINCEEFVRAAYGKAAPQD